jgi:hypothetical protein
MSEPEKTCETCGWWGQRQGWDGGSLEAGYCENPRSPLADRPTYCDQTCGEWKASPEPDYAQLS